MSAWVLRGLQGERGRRAAPRVGPPAGPDWRLLPGVVAGFFHDGLGARGHAIQLENDYYQRALAALDTAQPQGAAGKMLRGLAAWLFQRAY